MSFARAFLTTLAVLCGAGAVLSGETGEPPARKRKYSNAERLALPRLKAVHEDVVRLRGERRKPEPLPGLHDYRCILHAHAEDSSHTGGTLPEMLDDAKKAGISAIFLSDHFRPPRDFIDGRWRGMKDGVLFIPGSEARGCLLHPEASVLDKMERPLPELLQAVTAGDGLAFLSHAEERKDHPMEGFTGMEVYNRHWDSKKDTLSLIVLASKLTDPKELAELTEAVRLYPDELLAFQCDYPIVYLDKWDAETQRRKLTGVAANDCHHNQVLIVKMVDQETVLIGTNVDKDEAMRRFTSAVRPGIAEMTRGRQPGDILARLDLDPYERSFRNCATHILAPELTESALRAALKAGHAYVAHDWMCEATGFRFEIAGGGAADQPLAVTGDEVKFTAGMKLAAHFPVACQTRILRNGLQVFETKGADRAEFPLKEPGVYRVEGWLTLDGEARPWIFSNPIYLR
jgi:hypothetical protein